MKRSNEITRRNLLRRTALLAAGAGLGSETLLPNLAKAEVAVGRNEILRGLDGMSRAARAGTIMLNSNETRRVNATRNSGRRRNLPAP